MGSDKLQRLSDKLQNNPGYHTPQDIPKKNAFLYPNDPTAVFPQFEKPTLIDFRNSTIEFAGYEFSGTSRKNQVDANIADGVDVELEEIPEVEPLAEDDAVDDDEDTLMADFGSMGLGGATKKIKKKKLGDMEAERSGGNFLPFKSKTQKAKNKDGCKKSRKIMRW